MATVQYSSAYNFNNGTVTARTDTSFTYKRANNSNWHSGRVNITGLIAGHLYSITVNTNRTNNSLNLAIIGTTEDSNNGYFNCKDFGTGHFSSSTSYTVQVIPIGDTLTLDFIQHGGSSFYEFTFSNFEVVDLTMSELRENLNLIKTQLSSAKEIVDSIIEHTELTLYTELEYIESTGTQWIDSGIASNSNIKFAAKFNMNENTGNVIIGFTINDESRAFRLFNYEGGCWLDYGSGQRLNRINGGALTIGNTYEVEVGNRYVKNLVTNTNIIGSSAVGAFSYDNTINIFKGYDDTSHSSGKIYYLKIYENDTLVRDLIPVKRKSDNVICMYDRVTKTFFENQGTGEFIAGGEV